MAVHYCMHGIVCLLILLIHEGCANTCIISTTSSDIMVMGDKNPSQMSILEQNAEHDGSSIYYAEREDGTPFQFDSLCFSSTANKVFVKTLDEDGNDLHLFKFFNEPEGGLIDYCFEEQPFGDIQNISRIIMNFKDGGSYVVGNVTISGKAPCEGCGWSSYDDAGISGGSIPDQSIVGGWIARPFEFPWQVGLSDTGSTWIWCGGSIISSEFVITAAHCVDYGVASDFTVQIGVVNTNDFSDVVSIVVAERFQHPSYDVALLRLSEPVQFSYKAAPVCMPQQHSAFLVGEETTVSGWGNTVSGGSQSADLLYVNVPIMDLDECNVCMNDEVRLHEVCAGFCGDNAGDSCQGDSGGPLVYKRDDDSWELIGVVSWGYGCAASTPGIYVDVYQIRDWLMGIVPELDFGPQCDAGQFQCYDESCIDETLACDGTPNCPEGEDETGCIFCTDDQFQCDDGECIPWYYECDIYVDCNGAEDEIHCVCMYDEFACDDGECIPDNYECDGYDDCSNAEDELNCDPCASDEFTCDDGECIPESYLCDDYLDCQNGEDEMHCGPDCLFDLVATSDAQEFTSHPGYSVENYDNDMDCYWFITAPEDTVIALTFQAFNIEWEFNCEFDYVQVFDSDYTTILWELCGDVDPVTITSTSNHMMVHFFTDGSETDLGFVASYLAVPDPAADVNPELIVSESENVYGNDVILRSTHITSGGRKSWIVNQHPLPAGILDTFYLYVHSNEMDGESAVPIWLQIWRPVDANPNVFTLEWEHELIVDHSNPSGVFYEVNVLSEQFDVLQNDKIGWTIDREEGVISLDYEEVAQTIFYSIAIERPEVGMEYEFDVLALPATFSIAVKVNPSNP